MSELVLTGLDGSNPLGFLAALGLTRVVAIATGGQSRLSWSNAEPRLHTPSSPSAEHLAALVMADARSAPVERMLEFKYLKVEKAGPKPFMGLVPQAAVYRAWLEARLQVVDEELLRIAGSLICGDVLEGGDPKKLASAELLQRHGVPFRDDIPLSLTLMQTPFDFTSRNTQFLDQLRHIREALSEAAIVRELCPGSGAIDAGSEEGDDCRTMGWDPLAEMPGALFLGRRLRSKPVMEWLAFRGLAFYPLSGRRGVIVAPGIRGRRKGGEFLWPLWSPPLGADMIASVLALPRIEARSREELAARGIHVVYRAGLVKQSDGYAGAFSPPGPVGA